MIQSESDKSNGKIFISYKILIVAVSVFVASTVLVGTLTALVNPGKCKSDENRLKKNFDHFKANKTTYEILKELSRNQKNYVKALDRCEELNEETDGELWESLRLPTNVIPHKYNVKIFTQMFAIETYSGEVTIEIEVLEDTQYIIVHAQFIEVFATSLFDLSDNRLELECDGLYLPNEYYIVKSKDKLLAGQRYIVDFYFAAFLNVFSSGIFEIKYNNDDNEYDGFKC